MKNITELREDLSEVFTGLRNGSVDPKVAKEINNAAGKIIHTVKVQLEYASLTKIKPRIPYIK
jgi:hypothetical protein|tara:strand:- start:640 stop:828 length:189 start_codon:yes stop_codon:yes gene_type:complete